MFLALALCVLPQATPPQAGFLRDVRVELLQDQRLSFEAKVAFPATLSRRSFVVEGLAADGTLLGSRNATARVEAAGGRRRGMLDARFEIELPALSGVAQWRVRLRS